MHLRKTGQKCQVVNISSVCQWLFLLMRVYVAPVGRLVNMKLYHRGGDNFLELSSKKKWGSIV